MSSYKNPVKIVRITIIATLETLEIRKRQFRKSILRVSELDDQVKGGRVNFDLARNEVLMLFDPLL